MSRKSTASSPAVPPPTIARPYPELGHAHPPSAGWAAVDAFVCGVIRRAMATDHQVESANIGKAAPKPDFLDEKAEQGDGRLKEEGEAQSGGSDEVWWLLYCTVLWCTVVLVVNTRIPERYERGRGDRTGPAEAADAY